MKLETLTVWVGLAASVAIVLGYLHERSNTAHYAALQNQVADNSRRIRALEGKR